MGSEVVTIAYNDGVSFKLSDINSDEFQHVFALETESINGGAGDEFSHNYPVKTLLALFKQSPTGHFDIGEKGILNINVNDLR